MSCAQYACYCNISLHPLADLLPRMPYSKVRSHHLLFRRGRASLSLKCNPFISETRNFSNRTKEWQSYPYRKHDELWRQSQCPWLWHSKKFNQNELFGGCQWFSLPARKQPTCFFKHWFLGRFFSAHICWSLYFHVCGRSWKKRKAHPSNGPTKPDNELSFGVHGRITPRRKCWKVIKTFFGCSLRNLASMLFLLDFGFMVRWNIAHWIYEVLCVLKRLFFLLLGGFCYILK